MESQAAEELRHRGATIIPSSSPRAIEWTAEELTSGRVVALPTDTVYGIAASLAHPEAIDRIFAIKDRDPLRKLPILLSSVDVLANLASMLTESMLLMIGHFWPGPTTFVVPTDRSLPDGVARNNTIAVRVPNHPLAIEVIERAGGAVACTSANRTNLPPALTAAEVEASVGAEVDVILDGGLAPGGMASTIVRITSDAPEILRIGPVDEPAIRLAWENYVERG